MAAVYPSQLRALLGPDAVVLADVLERLRGLEARGVRIPLLDADPATDDPANTWLFEDERLNLRTDGGTVFRLRSWPGVPSKPSNADAEAAGLEIYRHSSSDELKVQRPDGTWARYASITAVSTADSPPEQTTSSKPKPKQTQPKTRTRTYSATNATAYDSAGHTHGGQRLNYGRFDSTHGEAKIMYFFDEAAIRADIDPSRIKRVQLSLRNLDAFRFSGVTLHFGGHNEPTPPNNYKVVRRSVSQDHWPHTGRGREWRTVADWFGRNLRDGTIKGVVIDQPSTSKVFYGAAADDLRIRITYRG